MAQEFFSQAQAARYTGFHARTLQRAERRGLLPAVGEGRGKRYRRGDLDKLPLLLQRAVTVSDRQLPSVTMK